MRRSRATMTGQRAVRRAPAGTLASQLGERRFQRHQVAGYDLNLAQEMRCAE